MSYPILSVEDFGAAMRRTGDLDPIYVMLNGAQLDPATKARWCLAYWCFYHAGFSSCAADRWDAPDFWDFMERAAANTTFCDATQDGRWPRGTERRHFRGKASVNSVARLRSEFPDPTKALESLIDGPLDFWSVRARVLRWPAFGPWIAFKVADMLDAVMGIPVDFTGTEAAFFDDPKEGALIVFQQSGKDPAWLPEKDRATRITEAVVDRLLKVTFASTPVPHTGRNVRTQEVETILCKYKSHTKGRYPVGKDTHEILHGLEPWTKHSTTATRCRDALVRHVAGGR